MISIASEPKGFFKYTCIMSVTMLDKLVMSGLIHTNTGVNTIHSK